MANSTPPVTKTSKPASKISREIQALNDQPLPFIQNLEHLEENGKQVVKGIIIGPAGSDYDGGHFRFTFIFPSGYPFKPPEFIINTGICHPNITLRKGVVCLDTLLIGWGPAITLSRILTDFHSLLAIPLYDFPVEEEDDDDKKEEKNPEKARRWTQQFASPNQ